jgi:hypothetical protein
MWTQIYYILGVSAVIITNIRPFIDYGFVAGAWRWWNGEQAAAPATRAVTAEHNQHRNQEHVAVDIEELRAANHGRVTRENLYNSDSEESSVAAEAFATQGHRSFSGAVFASEIRNPRDALEQTEREDSQSTSSITYRTIERERQDSVSSVDTPHPPMEIRISSPTFPVPRLGEMSIQTNLMGTTDVAVENSVE